MAPRNTCFFPFIKDFGEESTFNLRAYSEFWSHVFMENRLIFLDKLLNKPKTKPFSRVNSIYGRREQF